MILLITPLEIQNKEFKRSFRGYDSRNVDEFLDEIIEDYERVYKENIELKDKVNMLADQIRQYNTLEDTLKSTLIVAQTTADEVIASARQKAESIIQGAEVQGQKLIEIARDDVRNIKSEYDSLKKEIFIFKTRYQSFIEAQLMSLEEFHNEIEKKEEGSIDLIKADDNSNGIDELGEADDLGA